MSECEVFASSYGACERKHLLRCFLTYHVFCDSDSTGWGSMHRHHRHQGGYQRYERENGVARYQLVRVICVMFINIIVKIADKSTKFVLCASLLQKDDFLLVTILLFLENTRVYNGIYWLGARSVRSVRGRI